MRAFKAAGTPRCIKVDNGRPLADPQRETVPVLALWLLALGIKVIFNRPRTPQDNAKVERSQGVLSNWAEWEKCPDSFALQVRLWEEADFHNTLYPVSRLGHKTRAEAFPGLLRSPRHFDPADFDPQRAIDFVAKGTWERDVSKQGQFSFWGQRIQAGTKYAHQRISLKLDPKTNRWLAFDKAGAVVKIFDSKITDQNLWNLNLS